MYIHINYSICDTIRKAPDAVGIRLARSKSRFAKDDRDRRFEYAKMDLHCFADAS